MRVLDVLIELFNTRHTALEKTVSHKTRHERAQFLRRFFRDLKLKAGFKTVPDPRNLGNRHLQAMVLVWQREALAPATIQTYLSFLRGLAQWMGKFGFVHAPAQYGLRPAEYRRHENAQHDKSWSAQGIDATAVIRQVAAYDVRVAASLRLMQAFGLRRKESIQVRPFEHVKPFANTGLPEDQKEAEHYLWVKGKGGRVRWIAVVRPEQLDAIAQAQALAHAKEDHVADPERDLKSNLRRLDYVLVKFGITKARSGATAHGLRHQALNDAYERETGIASPVRGGGNVDLDVDRAARLHVSRLAGHARVRAAGAYVGSRPVDTKGAETTADGMPDGVEAINSNEPRE